MIALAEGETTITATVGTASDTCVVTVEPTESQLPSVDPSEPVNEVALGVGQEAASAVENTIESILVDIALGNEVTGVSSETAAAITQAVNNWKTISTEVVATPVDDAEADEKDKILSVLKENEAVAQYLNLQVLVKADGDKIGEINELNQAITFTVAIPEALKAEGRSFFVVRLHDGLAEKLDTVMNADGTLSFATDKFSTYALAYADPTSTNPGVSEDGDNSGTPETKPENKPTAGNDAPADGTQTDNGYLPQTGDSNSALWLLLVLAAGATLTSVIAYSRIRKRNR